MGLDELKLADVEVSVGSKIFVVIDEVHHLFIGSVALRDACFAAPFSDGIGKCVVNILANILKTRVRDKMQLLANKEKVTTC